MTLSKEEIEYRNQKAKELLEESDPLNGQRGGPEVAAYNRAAEKDRETQKKIGWDGSSGSQSNQGGK